MDIDIRHLGDLDPVTRLDYEAAVTKALAGRALAELQAVTLDGIAVPWIGTPRPEALPIAGRAAGAPWSIVQKVALDDPAAANAEILQDLAGGVDGIDLILPPGGLPDEATLARALEGVHLDMVAMHLTGGRDPRAALDRLAAIADGPPERLRLRAGFDPFVAAMAEGGDFTAAFARNADIARACAATTPPGDTMLLAVHGEAWHALGASDATQLAILLTAGAAYLADALEAGGDAVRLSSRIEFRVAADQNQFATMARLRAFRRLWALVLDAFGLRQAPAFVHAETAYRMETRRDPHVNILRSTIAAFAAAVAGADAITTVPHTALLGRPDAAARRLSRNVQTVLMDEATLHRVADPAAGAGGIEDFTDALAEKAWEAFQALERQGGLAAALSSGALQAAIAETDARERALVEGGRLPIIGTTSFPLPVEPDVAVRAGSPLSRPPLPGARRLAEPFEAMPTEKGGG